MKPIRLLKTAVLRPNEAARKVKIYKLVKRNILETIVDIYE